MATPPGGWPEFTPLGPLRDTSATPLIFTTGQAKGEPSFDRVGDTYFLHGFVFGSQSSPVDFEGISTSSLAVGDDIVNGWARRISGSTALIDHEVPPSDPDICDHFDTPSNWVYNAATAKWLQYFTYTPGVLTTQADTSTTAIGRIMAIGCFESDTGPAVGKSDYTVHFDIIVPTLEWEEGYAFGYNPEAGGITNWNGGCAEPTAYVKDNGEIRVVYRGHSSTQWRNAGRDPTSAATSSEWKIGYADMGADGKTPSKLATPFWDPRIEEGLVYQTFGGHTGAWHPAVCADPDGGVHLYVTRRYGIFHFYSATGDFDDLEGNPMNPVIALGQPNMPPAGEIGQPGVGEIGAPSIFVEQFRHILICDGCQNGERYSVPSVGTNFMLYWAATAARSVPGSGGGGGSSGPFGGSTGLGTPGVAGPVPRTSRNHVIPSQPAKTGWSSASVYAPAGSSVQMFVQATQNPSSQGVDVTLEGRFSPTAPWIPLTQVTGANSWQNKVDYFAIRRPTFAQGLLPALPEMRCTITSTPGSTNTVNAWIVVR